MIIPWQQLGADTLNNLLESYVLREGTDYGDQIYTLEEKVAQVHQQLSQGELVLVYSELHETVNILRQETFNASPKTEDTDEPFR